MLEEKKNKKQTDLLLQKNLRIGGLIERASIKTTPRSFYPRTCNQHNSPQSYSYPLKRISPLSRSPKEHTPKKKKKKKENPSIVSPNFSIISFYVPKSGESKLKPFLSSVSSSSILTWKKKKKKKQRTIFPPLEISLPNFYASTWTPPRKEGRGGRAS